MVEELSQAQYDTVYNFLSLVIASQLFTALFLVVNLRRVLPKYRPALIISATVCASSARPCSGQYGVPARAKSSRGSGFNRKGGAGRGIRPARDPDQFPAR